MNAEDFYKEYYPPIMHLFRDESDRQLQIFGIDDMINFAEEYHKKKLSKPKEYCQCDFPIIRNGEYCGNCWLDFETGNMKDKIYKIVGEHTDGVRKAKTLYDLSLITEKTNKDLNTLFALQLNKLK